MEAETQKFPYKGAMLVDLFSSLAYQIPERFYFYKYSIEEIQKCEPEYLVRFMAEKHKQNQTRIRKLCSAELIAYSIMNITSLYGQAIKKYRSGWTCGTHTNNVQAALSRTIATKYSDDQISYFVDFCGACDEGLFFSTMPIVTLRP